MEVVGDSEEYIKCRVEKASPGTDWENSLRLARLPGLGPDNTSFLFSLLHQILPTKERVARTKPNASSQCKAQGCQENTEESLSHALIHCQANDGVGLKLIECLSCLNPGLHAEAALRLDWNTDEDVELPAVWLTACTLRTIWNLRQANTKIKKHLIRSQLEAEINLLRETRYFEAIQKIEELAVDLFS